MIFRQLGSFFTFFTPFLSHKGLISRRLQRNAWKNSQGQKIKCEKAKTPGLLGNEEAMNLGILKYFTWKIEKWVGLKWRKGV
jgi:hypothetical protein